MKNYIAILITTFLLIGCASNSVKIKPNALPTNLSKQKIKRTDVEMAIYIPKWSLEYTYNNRQGIKTHFGKSMKQAFKDVGQVLMKNVEITDSTKSNAAGLFSSMHSSWDAKDGKLSLTINYTVYDGDYDVVLEGSATHSQDHSYNYTDVLYYNIAVRTAQKVFVDINQSLKPTAAIYPSEKTMDAISPLKLVNLTSPYNQLSAIAINEQGFILTPNKNLDQCLILEGEIDKKKINIEYQAKSTLLNLALFKTPKKLTYYATFADINNNSLGDPLVATSYRFKNKASVVMSFANLSSNSGVMGSFNSHLVTSAVAPATSLAGFYNQKGYLVGLFSNYLNYKWMLKRETIDENTYQMMQVSPVLKFLDQNNVSYHEAFTDKSERKGLTEATNNLVQINCYQ